MKHLKDALVSGNCKLARLHIPAVGMTSKGGEQLVKALESSQCKLTSLMLSNECMSDDCVKRLEEISEKSCHVDLR